MKRRIKPQAIALGLALSLSLSACTEPAPESTSDSNAPAPTTDAHPPVTDADTRPTVPVDPANQPVSNEPDTAANLSKWGGYGDATFGMDEAAFKQAWGGDLNNYDFEDKKYCFHLWPKGQKTSSDLAFMFVDGKFARYSTEGGSMVAPGGGKIGMTTAEIQKLYAGQVKAEPHNYTDGQYLRITQGSDVLIFETDAKGDAGKVKSWRVGRTPAIDYVEGCA